VMQIPSHRLSHPRRRYRARRAVRYSDPVTEGAGRRRRRRTNLADVSVLALLVAVLEGRNALAERHGRRRLGVVGRRRIVGEKDRARSRLDCVGSDRTGGHDCRTIFFLLFLFEIKLILGHYCFL
jgi:hypothetical protein